jgi:hypothetical protein
LNRDLVAADGIDVVPLGELNGDMIEDDVGCVQQVDATFAGVGIEIAPAKSEMAADDVVSAIEGNFAAHDADAIAGRGLAGDGDVVLDEDGGREIDVAADVENDDAIVTTDGVAE